MSVAEIVPVDGALLETILDATYPQWNDGLSRLAYGRWWDAQLRTTWGRDRLHRFALVDRGRVLASAKRYDFDAVIDGRRARVMGIGAVFTPAEHRRSGHARTLVERMMAESARGGFDFALLFSEIDPAYYRRLGFEAIEIEESGVEVIEKPGAPAALVRAGVDGDLPAIAAMNGTFAARFRFHLERPTDLIQYSLTKRRLLAGLGAHGEREVHFFVSEEGMAAVAYVVFTSHRGAWTIEECGDRDPSGARVGAILQVLLAREPTEAPPAIRGWLPRRFQPPQIRIVSRRPVDEVMMLRSLRGVPLPTLSAADVLYWHADLF